MRFQFFLLALWCLNSVWGTYNQTHLLALRVAPLPPWVVLGYSFFASGKISVVVVLSLAFKDVLPILLYNWPLNMLGFWLLLFHDQVKLMPRYTKHWNTRWTPFIEGGGVNFYAQVDICWQLKKDPSHLWTVLCSALLLRWCFCWARIDQPHSIAVCCLRPV